MSSNLSKYSNSKYKSKYLKYKNKYLLEKYEQDNIFDLKQQEINKNILNTTEESIDNINTIKQVSNKKINLNNTVLKTMPNKVNLNNIILESDNNLNKSIVEKLSYNLNLSNLEISENGFENNILNKSLNTNNANYNINQNENGMMKNTSKSVSKKTSKSASKKTSKRPSKKTSKSASKKINSIETQIKNKILDDKINWNEISKKDVKKINFGKNKITIGFIGGSKLELGFTSTLDETTWFEKFIRINIMDKEPHYDPTDTCNIKITKLFTITSDGYKKFIEYENLVGKKIKSIKWIGDSWMYPSNKQECDHNHVFKIQTTGSEYYLFILRCSSSGGIDTDLIINYKK